MSNEYNVELIQADGLTLLAKADSKHWLVLDSDPKFDGFDAAARPFELFLISIAGCTMMDVISILKKMRLRYDKLRVQLSAERRDEHPKIPTKIHINYLFEAENLPSDMVEKAISLSQEKYCSVSAVVKMAGIPVEWSYRIFPPNKELGQQ